MANKVKDNLAIEKNDCIYIVKWDDNSNSSENQPYPDDNDYNFYIIEESIKDLEPQPVEAVGKEDAVNATDGTIIYEVSEEELLENPSLLDRESLLESEDGKSGKQFVCPQCQSSFSRQYSLKVHIRTHTGEKPYKCTFDCHKRFATSGDLQRHVRTHTGDRPYKCTFEGCHITFATNANLRTHFRKHTGERPYKCNYEACEKSFMQLTNLKNHQRIHTGEKPYECDICKRCFSEYATLYKHRWTHIGREHYVCPVCNAIFKRDGTLVNHVSRCHPDYKGLDVNLTENVLKGNK